jgi:hypothetical protein
MQNKKNGPDSPRILSEFLTFMKFMQNVNIFKKVLDKLVR